MPPSQNRTAFVTGGTGFVGLNLAKELMIGAGMLPPCTGPRPT
jgi:nucleoside-diphosphate-sugar epimerase